MLPSTVLYAHQRRALGDEGRSSQRPDRSDLDTEGPDSSVSPVALLSTLVVVVGVYNFVIKDWFPL